jgi:hypothetical protein
METRTHLSPPPLPASVRTKLVAYQKRLWSTKTMEALFGALFGLALSFLLVFGLDRVIETPAMVRLVLLLVGLVGGIVILPVQLVRWVARYRSLIDVARRVAREDIRTGDSLLGVMELTTNGEEYRRSPELVTAAIQQGEADLARHELGHTLPTSRHRGWGALVALALVLVGAGAFLAPGAAKNAFARWSRPLADIDRFTFCQLVPFDEREVVARFEPFAIELALDPGSAREPELAELQLAGGEIIEARLEAGRYHFELEGLGKPTTARVHIGDYLGSLRIEPVDRPEVSAIFARVELPAYLELPEPLQKDVRGGTLGIVEGSQLELTAELTRELDSGAWTEGPVAVQGRRLVSLPVLASERKDTQLSWCDTFGLAGTVPFQLGLRTRPDARPTVQIEGLMPEMILIENQAASFSVRASDDFGVRHVGLEWHGVGPLEGHNQRADGEKNLGLGDPDSAALELAATLHPGLLGIDPQTLEVRAFALDALPGRERVYSAPVTVYVMTEEEHMIWVTRGLASWYDEAVEVRDTENNLLKTNEELLALSNEDLATAEAQRKIQTQAAAERVNGRRLDRLVRTGSKMLAEAARNTQFNSNTMDDWAEMMAALEAIADQRMPSVAEQLAKAAAVEKPRGVNINRETTAAAAAAKPKGAPAMPSDPTVTDGESSFNEAPEAKPVDPDAKASAGRPANLTLAGTVVQGGGAKDDSAPPPPDDSPDPPGPTKEELAKAVAEQRLLMEEFQRVAGAISETLANLEGSTFVKRLKALSRAESGIAKDLDGTLATGFGLSELPPESAETAAFVARVEATSGQRASLVRADLKAYIERQEAAGRDAHSFEDVHAEMGELGVAREMAAIGALTEFSRVGEALAAAENLADNLDRWAELLVGPG